MQASVIFILLVAASDLQMMSAFTITSPCAIQRMIQSSDRHYGMNRIIPQELHAREDNEDDDDRDFVYARSRSGRRDMEEGSYYDDNQQGSSKGRYQDNVEFFDLDDDDDDDLFDDDELDSDIYEETYNGIIPNPLLDAMGKFVDSLLCNISCIMAYAYLIVMLHIIS